VEAPISLEDIARERGARTQAEVDEYVELIGLLARPGERVPDPKQKLPIDSELLLPAFHYRNGERYESGADNLPFSHLFELPKQGLYGQVCVEGIAGTDAPERAIILFDAALEAWHGLADWYVVHEFAHAFCRALERMDPEFFKGWSARLEAEYQRQKAVNDCVTTYGANNEEEFLAEGFAAYFHVERRAPDPDRELSLYATERSQLDSAVFRKRYDGLRALIDEALDHVKHHHRW
jgi:hypothetical protein